VAGDDGVDEGYLSQYDASSISDLEKLSDCGQDEK
jgi:hypothetical protein